MRRVKTGIGTKIYFGFMALIVVALIIGGAGFLSLSRVVQYGELNAVARDIQAKILEARNLEKTYVLTKNQESYEKLIQSLEDLSALTAKLKTVLDETKKAEEIAAGKETYKTAAASLKQLDAADEQLLKDLQDAGKKIKEIAESEAARIAGEIKENVLQTTTAYLKEKALDTTRQVVDVGHDVLKYHHERGLPKADALEAIRNLHFSGNNYFFVVQEDLILVAHGSDRSLEGKDFGKIQDKKTGKTFMRELVDNTLKSGESFTEYFWTKPGMGEAIFPKITYAKSFKPWGLVVCAGIYVDDLEKQVATMGETIAAGLAKMQQAEAIKELNLEARLNATNYFAFGKNEEDVAVNLGKLKQLPIASGALRKEADQFLAAFNRRVENNQTRKTDITQIDQVAAKTLKISDEVKEMANENYLNSTTSGKTIIVGFIVFGILAGLALATILARSIIRPIRRVIAGIEESSDQVASAAGQVSSASQQLAEGSSEQAASLEETSSALEEITSMTKQNADNANQANRLMVESNQIVQKANHTMVNLTASMNEISKASEETQKIIKTIDEIAFQTNLLALNAAVEAARAGEAGAGFAVVADEVRNLALRAAEAARNTADLIEGTVKKVKEGSALVEMTNGDFKEMATSVTKSGELVGEIAAASQEQAQGISQVSNAVAEMDRVVQQNAANAEESAAAAEQMSAQAEQMKTLIKEMVDLVGVDGKKESVSKKKKGKIQQLRTMVGKATSREEMSVRKQAPVRHHRVGEKKGNGSTREVKPEQVIPFDEDLRDF